ncbi:MAG: hypothetical protein ACXWEJ_11130 [Actinomycetota bacterium]
MSSETREAKLRAAIGQLVDDDIIDVAVCHPRGYTRAQGAGSLLGGAAGSTGNFAGVGMVLGTAVGGRLFAPLKDMPPRIGLAVTADAVYAVSMELRGFDNMTPMVKFERADTKVELSQHVMVKHLTLTDTEHDVSLLLETKMLNNYDIKAFAELLQIGPSHVEADDSD